MGAVGNLKGRLYVLDMNVNMISVMHMLDDILNATITFKKPNGVGNCIIRHKLQQFQEVTFESKNPIVPGLRHTWLGLLDMDDNEIW
jgi:hypothetical protein